MVSPSHFFEVRSLFVGNAFPMKKFVRLNLQRNRRQERERLYIICATMHTTSKFKFHQNSVPRGTNETETVSPKRISRRAFAHDAAAIAAVSMSPSSLLALRHRDGSELSPQPGAADNKLSLTAEQLQEVEARLANIIRKYGDRLSEEQREHLRRILSYNETMLAPVRAFPLKNSDTPATILKLSTGAASSQSHSSPSKSEGRTS